MMFKERIREGCCGGEAASNRLLIRKDPVAVNLDSVAVVIVLLKES